MVRFVPIAGADTGRLIGAVYVVCIVAAAIAGVLFLLVLDRLAPTLAFLHAHGWDALFVIATVAWSIFIFHDGVLVGPGRTHRHEAGDRDAVPAARGRVRVHQRDRAEVARGRQRRGGEVRTVHRRAGEIRARRAGHERGGTSIPCIAHARDRDPVTRLPVNTGYWLLVRVIGYLNPRDGHLAERGVPRVR